MSVVPPSDAVLDIMRSASGSVLIAAPYIKSHALQNLLSELPNTATELICITRWLPEDIASGVCDLEILDDVTGCTGGKLLVHPHLHAKYYRANGRCLVGSANITGRGLGWITPANIELLVELPSDFVGLADWEAALISSAVPATPELRDEIKREAERLIEAGDVRAVPEVEQGSEDEVAVSQWIPSCPVPDRLWSVYVSAATGTMISSAREAAEHDLAALAPPSGLTQELFGAYMAGILKQMPLIAKIDELASSGLTDAQAYEFLSEKLGADPSYPLEQTWRILKAWLIHFFPQTYRLETGQELLVKGKELSR